MLMPTAADVTRRIYNDAEKLRREQCLGGDPSKVDYSIMPTCCNCELPIMSGKPLICSGCKAPVFCSMNCHKSNWKAGRHGSPGHKLLCAKNKVHMEKVPQVQALLKQFPWGRIEKDGTFAEPLVRALHNVLGAEGFGYWSIPGGSNPHLKHASDPPRPAGAPCIDDAKGFEHGYMLLSDKLSTDETGWKLEKRLIPRLVFELGTEPKLASKVDIVDWDSWYKWRNLPKESPAALLMHYPLTVYQLLALHVHYIGAEVELNMLPLFSELALLLPYTDIKMTLFGVAVHSLVKTAKKNSIVMKAKQNQPVYTYTSPTSCGASTLSIFLYGDHEDWHQQHPFIRYIYNKPDAVVGLNAGLTNYPAWQSVILYCHMYNESFAVTEYAEQSAEQQRDSFPLIIDHILPQARLSYHGSEINNLTRPREYPIAFNPFQCPGQRGIGQTRLPSVPNGFTIRVVGDDQQGVVRSVSAGVPGPASDLE
ncbi:hypothetical protein BDR07DRAFT_1478305 [Suillus spraguei]|nr:hypothetical protein BDR07DRAFT_1478305 [Suillus spraguei]